jgi:Uma2 family endonuclease
MGRKIETMKAEVIESPLTSEELAVRYRALCDDPRFANVPGKIELDVWGRMVMSPPSNYHGAVQSALAMRLASLGGRAFTEASVLTAAGLFVADVAWASLAFMQAHGFETPFTLAPELCAEVASPSNSRKELREKTDAYLAAGAEEVWIVYTETKRCEFYGKDGLLQRSRFAVDLSKLFD